MEANMLCTHTMLIYPSAGNNHNLLPCFAPHFYKIRSQELCSSCRTCDTGYRVPQADSYVPGILIGPISALIAKIYVS